MEAIVQQIPAESLYITNSDNMELKLRIVGLLVKSELTIIEIATGLDEYYSYVHRIATRLIQENVILKRKAGHSYLCSLNLKNEKARALLQLNEIEKKSELYARNKELRLISDDLVALFQPQGILSMVLFGSFAKGNQSNESDIDILVISESKLNTGRASREIHAKYGREAGIIVLSQEGFKHQIEMPVIKEIVKHHYVIYGAETFVRLMVDDGTAGKDN